MKRMLAIFLALTLLLFSACTAAPQESEQKKATKSEETATILGDTVSYTLGRVYCTEKLVPDDTTGFYKYYEASEGNTLFVVEAELTNIDDHLYRVWTLAEAKLTVDGTDYEAKIAVPLEGQDDSFGNGNIEMESDQTRQVYYLFDIPASAADDTLSFTMTAGGETEKHELTAE